MKSNAKTTILAIALALFLSSCTATNPYRGEPGENGKVAGFFNGLWDGSIAPITFIVSLFNSNVAVYNPHSSGWYTFGFVIGISGLSSGSTSATNKK